MRVFLAMTPYHTTVPLLPNLSTFHEHYSPHHPLSRFLVQGEVPVEQKVKWIITKPAQLPKKQKNPPPYMEKPGFLIFYLCTMRDPLSHISFTENRYPLFPVNG